MKFYAAADRLIGTLGTAERCNALREIMSYIHAGVANVTDYDVLLEILCYTTGWEVEDLRELFAMAETRDYVWLDDMEDDQCPD